MLDVCKLLKMAGEPCKPDSVRRRLSRVKRRDDHSSSPGLAAGIERPTRGFILPCSSRRTEGNAHAFASELSEPGQLSPPIWSCTARGLPCLWHCCQSGGLLPHLFTLACAALHSKMFRRFASGLSPGYAPPAVYSLWHFP